MKPHQKQWEFLKSKFESGNLSHAYLFSGPDEAGKEAFAVQLAKLINCPAPSAPCNACANCTLLEKESFPDVFVVKSINSESSAKNERDMMEIDVAQVRDVNTFLSRTAYYGGYKTVIVEHAERMNREAQNSFLKTLEEPKGKTLIILLSSKPEVLLETIFSRCQVLAFFASKPYQLTPEEQKMLKEVLAVAHGELAAKFQYTKKVNLEGSAVLDIMKALTQYFRNAMLQKLGALPGTPALPETYSVEKIAHIIKVTQKLQMQLATSNASPKLALEILLMET